MTVSDGLYSTYTYIGSRDRNGGKERPFLEASVMIDKIRELL